jgi:hypothetical protein
MPRYPSLFQISTEVWLNHLSGNAVKPITLADIEDATFDAFAEHDFDWIWLLSPLTTGPRPMRAGTKPAVILSNALR